MIRLEARQEMARHIEQAHAAGARLKPACELAGIDMRTLQRWKAGDGLVRGDGRPEAVHEPPTPALSDAGGGDARQDRLPRLRPAQRELQERRRDLLGRRLQCGPARRAARGRGARLAHRRPRRPRHLGRGRRRRGGAAPQVAGGGYGGGARAAPPGGGPAHGEEPRAARPRSRVSGYIIRSASSRICRISATTARSSTDPD